MTVAVTHFTATDPHPATDPARDVSGDHPDPVTLSEPRHDDQGRLRWGSMPPPRSRGSGDTR